MSAGERIAHAVVMAFAVVGLIWVGASALGHPDVLVPALAAGGAMLLYQALPLDF